MSDSICPICKEPAQITSLLPHRDAEKIFCARCGHFAIHTIMLMQFENMQDRSLLPFLSAHIRQNSSPNNPIFLEQESWQSYAEVHKKTPVLRKLGLALKLVADRSSWPGAPVAIPYKDCPLIDASNESELRFLLNQLKDSGFLESASHDDVVAKRYLCSVSAKGWEKLEAQTIAGIPGRCFVAMSFDPSLDEAWEKGIYPALHDDCKLDAVRIDKVHHNEKICDKLVAEIRLNQFLVADFTLHRQGVYFEAGYALGLGRPVIWTCKENELAKAHFDTRQYNHIVWTTPSELREKLRDRVIATITKPDS